MADTQNAKTLSKEMVRVDEENFEIIETRETTTNINFKELLIKLRSFKSDIKNKINNRIAEETMLNNAIETYNKALVDLVEAKSKFDYEFEIPSNITFDSIIEEINGANEEAVA